MPKATGFTMMLMFIVVIACQQETEIRYYDNGQVEFEVPLINGKWHGEARGYYENGELKGRMTFVNNKREGFCYEYFPSGAVKEKMEFRNNIQVGTDELYNESGQLIEKTFFDDMGRPIDFARFDKNGKRDYSFFSPIAYLSDTARKDLADTLWISLGNADPNRFDAGVLLVTSGFAGSNPGDTLALQESTNAEGFFFRFIPKKEGSDRIYAMLLFPNEKPITLEYEFEVKP